MKRCQYSGEGVHLPQQGRGQGLHLREHGIDATEFSLLTGGHHHPRTLAAGDNRSGKCHPESITQRGARGNGVGPFPDRERFPCQHGLLGLQFPHVQKSEVCGDLVSGLQKNDISRNQFFRGDGFSSAISQSDRMQGKKRLQRFQCPLGFAFMQKTDQGIDEYHAQNDGGIDPMSKSRRHRGRSQQDVNQNIVELHQEAAQRSSFTRGRQAIGTEAEMGQTLRRFFRFKPGGMAVQSNGDFLGGKGMPGNRRRRVGHVCFPLMVDFRERSVLCSCRPEEQDNLLKTGCRG